MICSKVEVAQRSWILFDKEAFLRDATNLTVRFMGRVISDYAFVKEKNFTSWDLFAYYQGVCRVFRIDMEMEMNQYVAFIIEGGGMRFGEPMYSTYI